MNSITITLRHILVNFPLHHSCELHKTGVNNSQCMEGGVNEKSNKRRLDIDWETLLSSHNEEPPEIVVKSTRVAMVELPKPYSSGTDAQNLTDHELNVTIDRQEMNFKKNGPKLPDNGAKILEAVKMFKKERDRRKSPIDKIDYKTVNAFVEEVSLVSQPDRRIEISNAELSPKGTHKGKLLAGEGPSQCPRNLPMKAGSDSGRRGRTNSIFHHEGLFFRCSRKMKDDFNAPLPSHKLKSREDQTFILLDEEDPQLTERNEQKKMIKE